MLTNNCRGGTPWPPRVAKKLLSGHDSFPRNRKGIAGWHSVATPCRQKSYFRFRVMIPFTPRKGIVGVALRGPPCRQKSYFRFRVMIPFTASHGHRGVATECHPVSPKKLLSIPGHDSFHRLARASRGGHGVPPLQFLCRQFDSEYRATTGVITCSEQAAVFRNYPMGQSQANAVSSRFRCKKGNKDPL